MTNPTPEAIEALVKALRTKSAMINMGERIAWGSETALMDQAADMLTAISQPDPTGGWCSDMEAAPRDEGWIRTADRLPEKPGKSSYEYVRCLIFVNGDTEIGMWNCEHLCWDDDEGDDFRYHPTEPTHWQRITPPVRGQEKGGA